MDGAVAGPAPGPFALDPAARQPAPFRPWRAPGTAAPAHAARPRGAAPHRLSAAGGGGTGGLRRPLHLLRRVPPLGRAFAARGAPYPAAAPPRVMAAARPPAAWQAETAVAAAAAAAWPHANCRPAGLRVASWQALGLLIAGVSSMRSEEFDTLSDRAKTGDAVSKVELTMLLQKDL